MPSITSASTWIDTVTSPGSATGGGAARSAAPAADTPAIDPVCQMRVPTSGEAAIVLEWGGRRLHFCGLPCLSRFAAAPDTYLTRAR